MIHAHAPGKLVLLGEYAVLEGAPALVAAVDRRARVRLNPLSQNETSQLTSLELGLTKHPFTYDHVSKAVQFAPGLAASTQQQLALFASVYQSAQTPNVPSLHVELDTSAFHLHPGGPKLGIGSSAALTVALTLALRSELSAESLFATAWQAHSQQGSGIDVAASVFGGVLNFQRRGANVPHIESLTWPQELYMVPVWSGRSVATASMLIRMQEYKHHNSAAYHAAMTRLAELSQQGIQSLRAHHVDQFCTVVHAYFKELQALSRASGISIVSSEHQNIAQLVAQIGGVYKPSGAGGGDMGCAFCTSPHTAERLREALHSAGFVPLALPLTQQGARAQIR